MLIDMVRDSPVEAGFSSFIAEQLSSIHQSNISQKLSSKSYFSKIWHPRKRTDEYRRIYHPKIFKRNNPIVRLMVLLLQQDNIASLAGLSREEVNLFSAYIFKAVFAGIQQQLKFRGKDATGNDRVGVLVELFILRELLDWDLCTGLLWQKIFLNIEESTSAKQHPIPPSINSDHQVHLVDVLKFTSFAFIEIHKMPVIQKFFQTLGEVSRHLRLYCDYWLRQLKFETLQQSSFYEYILKYFSHPLKYLALDHVPNLRNMDSGGDAPAEQQIRLFSGISQSLARLRFIYKQEEFLSLLKEVLQRTPSERYQDFTDKVICPNQTAEVPGNLTDHKAKILTEEVFDILRGSNRVFIEDKLKEFVKELVVNALAVRELALF